MRLLFLITTCFFNIQIGFSQKFYASQHPDYISNVDSADFHFEMKHYEIAKSFYEKVHVVILSFSFSMKNLKKEDIEPSENFGLSTVVAEFGLLLKSSPYK